MGGHCLRRAYVACFIAGVRAHVIARWRDYVTKANWTSPPSRPFLCVTLLFDFVIYMCVCEIGLGPSSAE